MNKFSKGFLCCVLSAVIFGLLPLYTKLLGSGGASVFMQVFFRQLFSLPLLFAINKAGKKEKTAVTKKDFLTAAGLSIFGLLLTESLLMISYRYIPSGTATSIHYLYPLLVLLISAVFYKDKITVRNLICFAVCMGGIVLLYNPEAGFTVKGAVIAFSSGVAWAIYSVLLEKTGITDRIPQITLSLIMNVVNCVAAFLCSLIFGEFTLNFSLKIYLLMILFSWSEAVLASTLYRAGVGLIDSRRAAIVSTLEPVTSIIVGILILKEQASVRGLFGCTLILLSSILLVLFTKEKKT